MDNQGGRVVATRVEETADNTNVCLRHQEAALGHCNIFEFSSRE